ncbi:hypothetical protein BXT84_00635 [Sulfobacillus thermotolerans]|uniref:ANTAR domain-containing protein n=1 Tax=Sulfobacillus thermotolerans TaxID=338644 RepID=A0ABM6RMU2_9FIRM|nr:hypothetical protein BXT84_00635 [Sulfobacillus thermotolerans]
MRTMVVTLQELVVAARDYGIEDVAEAESLAQQAFNTGLASATVIMFDTLRTLVATSAQRRRDEAERIRQEIL